MLLSIEKRTRNAWSSRDSSTPFPTTLNRQSPAVPVRNLDGLLSGRNSFASYTHLIYAAHRFRSHSGPFLPPIRRPGGHPITTRFPLNRSGNAIDIPNWFAKISLPRIKTASQMSCTGTRAARIRRVSSLGISTASATRRCSITARATCSDPSDEPRTTPRDDRGRF
jgi:hypothetical protein